MSRLKVDNIEARSGNNVAFEDPMQLKSVTTTQRDALSSPQAGDTVYNSTTGTIDYYNGTQWNSNQAGNTFVFTLSYLVIAGGGGGGGPSGNSSGCGGGGAGGYRNSYSYGSEKSGDNSTVETALTITYGDTLAVSVGGGGGGNTNGTDSSFYTIT